jgi:hypothetical protein
MTTLSSSSPSTEASAAAAVVTLCSSGGGYLWNTGAQLLISCCDSPQLFILFVSESNIAKLTTACYFSGSSSLGGDDIDLFTFSCSDAIPLSSAIIPCTAVTVIGE